MAEVGVAGLVAAVAVAVPVALRADPGDLVVVVAPVDHRVGDVEGHVLEVQQLASAEAIHVQLRMLVERSKA